MKEIEDETEEVTASDDDNSRDLELLSGEEAEEYYNSQAWQRKVNDIIGTYSNIHHPTKENYSQLQQPTTCTQGSSPQTPHLNLLSTPTLYVLPLQTEMSQLGIFLLPSHNPHSMVAPAAMPVHLLHLYYVNCT